MKTSNKLLILIVTLFFLVPLTGMIIVRKTFYVSAGNNFGYTPELINQPLKTETPGRKTIVINQPFDAVNLVNANNSSVELHLDHDDNYGAKVQEVIADQFSFEVEDGVLNISFKDGFSNGYRNKPIITVYAPQVKKLSANNTANFDLITVTDSLSINLKDCNFFNTGNTRIATITTVVNGDTVRNATYNETSLKNLNINLVNSKMDMRSINIDRLTITAQNSTVEMDGGGSTGKQSSIAHFNITTIGPNTLQIKNFVLKDVKAEISDDTYVYVPTVILKKLFK